jgi:hypothetical protein
MAPAAVCADFVPASERLRLVLVVRCARKRMGPGTEESPLLVDPPDDLSGNRLDRQRGGVDDVDTPAAIVRAPAAPPRPARLVERPSDCITSVREVGSTACSRIQAAQSRWSWSSPPLRSNHSLPRA